MKDGVILINKEAGYTSFDVVAKLRGILKEKKLGHGGTLDPNVTGILPVFIARGTKAIDLLDVTSKRYTATFRLGTVTDTQDIWGEVIKTAEPVRDIDRIKQTVLSFKGETRQIPPMYSAIKINGKRLYELAREGIEIERKSRSVTIYDITFDGKCENEDEYGFSVFCSKGTYVRTLCNDIGEMLGCGAVMTSLCRTSALGFSLENAHTLSEVQKAADEGRIDELVLPIERVFEPFIPIMLTSEQTKQYVNGVPIEPHRIPGVIYFKGLTVCEWQKYRVYDENRKFIGVGKVMYPEAKFRNLKMF